MQVVWFLVGCTFMLTICAIYRYFTNRKAKPITKADIIIEDPFKLLKQSVKEASEAVNELLIKLDKI